MNLLRTRLSWIQTNRKESLAMTITYHIVAFEKNNNGNPKLDFILQNLK